MSARKSSQASNAITFIKLIHYTYKLLSDTSASSRDYNLLSKDEPMKIIKREPQAILAM